MKSTAELLKEFPPERGTVPLRELYAANTITRDEWDRYRLAQAREWARQMAAERSAVNAR